MCSINKEKVVKIYAYYIANYPDNCNYNYENDQKLSSMLRGLNKAEIANLLLDYISSEEGGILFFNQEKKYNFTNKVQDCLV